MCSQSLNEFYIIMGITGQLVLRSYIINEHVPAKPLASNLNVVFSTETQASNEIHGQLRCIPSLKFPFAQNEIIPTSVPVTDSQLLVPADEVTGTKRVVQLTIDGALVDINYAPGDTIAVLPSNNGQVVTSLLERLQLLEQADTICNVTLQSNCAKKSAKVPAHVPANTTPREIFTHCVELNGVLQKQFLSALASCTSDPSEQNFLSSLSSKQGSAHYNELVLERGLRLPDVLELCKTCQPSLALLVEYLTRLLPRPYSIANSPLGSGNKIHIIYSVLSQNPGTTTSLFESQPTKLLIYPRTINTFRYTSQDLNSNQVLVAVGTGLAPFLGFVEHKQHLLKQGEFNRDSGQTWIYVGAKTPQAVLKRDYLLQMQESNVLQRLQMCHSQTTEADAPKHVQQLLEEDALELVKLLEEASTTLYICADGAKISQAITAGIQKCLQNILQLNEVDAAQRVKDWRLAGKYREDIWP